MAFITIYLLSIVSNQEDRLENDQKNMYGCSSGSSRWEGKARANGQKRTRAERKDQGITPKPLMRIQRREIIKQVVVRNWEWTQTKNWLSDWKRGWELERHCRESEGRGHMSAAQKGSPGQDGTAFFCPCVPFGEVLLPSFLKAQTAATQGNMCFCISPTTSLYDRGGIVIFTGNATTQTHRGSSREGQNSDANLSCHTQSVSVYLYLEVFPNVPQPNRFQRMGNKRGCPRFRNKQIYLGLFSSITFLCPKCNGPRQARNRCTVPHALCCPRVPGQPEWRNPYEDYRRLGMKMDHSDVLFFLYFFYLNLSVFFTYLFQYGLLLPYKHFGESKFLITHIKLVIFLTIYIPYFIFLLLNKQSLEYYDVLETSH